MRHNVECPGLLPHPSLPHASSWAVQTVNLVAKKMSRYFAESGYVVMLGWCQELSQL